MKMVKRDWWIQVASFTPKDGDSEKYIYTLCKDKAEAESCVDKFHIDLFPVQDVRSLEAENARLREALESSNETLAYLINEESLSDGSVRLANQQKDANFVALEAAKGSADV